MENIQENGRTFTVYKSENISSEILEDANTVSLHVEGINMYMINAFQYNEDLCIVRNDKYEPVSVCLFSDDGNNLFLSCLGTSLKKIKNEQTGKSNNHATWLLKKSFDYARECGYMKVVLTCDDSLIQYYTDRGFSRDEELSDNFDSYMYKIV